MPIFDQDVKEFVQQGETHEQRESKLVRIRSCGTRLAGKSRYAAYREYVASLEEHASNFALQEGPRS